MTYYAYVHARPDTRDQRGVFYVGKGVGGRCKPLPARNRHHGFVLAKHGADKILVGKLACSSEAQAFELERGLIKCLRRAGVVLTNQTDGGDGSSGYIHTDEAKEAIGKASKLNAQRPEVQAARSEASTRSNYERWADPEYKAKASAAMRGKPKTVSEKALAARKLNLSKTSFEARSAAAKRRWADPDFKTKMAEKKKAAWADPEKRSKMMEGRSEGISKSWLNTETRNKRIRGIKNSSNTQKKEV